ncbi:hypothetical protein NL108_013454 [Boleophthalmus pectinirostris]|nr:hypothetical protein NL108_013454 [Boleophthalmus pectinirostris]
MSWLLLLCCWRNTQMHRNQSYRRSMERRWRRCMKRRWRRWRRRSMRSMRRTTPVILRVLFRQRASQSTPKTVVSPLLLAHRPVTLIRSPEQLHLTPALPNPHLTAMALYPSVTRPWQK